MKQLFDEAVTASNEIELSRRTRDEIANPAPAGERHSQAIKLAISLLGQGLNASAVFAQLRSMYDDDVSDRELNDILNWAGAKNPQPCSNNRASKVSTVSTPARVTPQQAKRNVEAFLKGWHCTIADLWHASAWYPCEDWHNDSAQLIAALYEPTDFINIVTAFVLEKTKDGVDKACPRGGGETFLRDEWLRRLRDAPAPRSKAGAWIRINPIKGPSGSGVSGSYSDSDVASFRFLLLESDILPIGVQLSLWSTLALPVAVLIDSGGRSVHAWLKVDCVDESQYRETTARIYKLLAPFGPDLANKNPSRFARLPGVKREIGGDSACDEQRLLYLNPSPCTRPIFER